MIRNPYTKARYPSNINAKNIQVENLSLITPEGSIKLKIDTIGKIDQVLVKTSNGFKWKDIQKISNINLINTDQEIDLITLDLTNIPSGTPIGLTASFINTRKGDISLTNDQQMILKYNIKFKLSNTLLDYYIKFYSNDVEIYYKILGESILENEPTSITDSFIIPFFKETDVITCKITTDEEITDTTKITILKNSYYELIIL